MQKIKSETEFIRRLSPIISIRIWRKATEDECLSYGDQCRTADSLYRTSLFRPKMSIFLHWFEWRTHAMRCSGCANGRAGREWGTAVYQSLSAWVASVRAIDHTHGSDRPFVNHSAPQTLDVLVLNNRHSYVGYERKAKKVCKRYSILIYNRMRANTEQRSAAVVAPLGERATHRATDEPNPCHALNWLWRHRYYTLTDNTKTSPEHCLRLNVRWGRREGSQGDDGMCSAVRVIIEKI